MRIRTIAHLCHPYGLTCVLLPFFVGVGACVEAEILVTDLTGTNQKNEPECVVAMNCWDGDPATEDICTPEGVCIYLKDSDTTASAGYAMPGIDNVNRDRCDVARVFAESGTMELPLKESATGISRFTAVEQGTVVRILISEPALVEVEINSPDPGNISFVLLDDCLNSAETRLAWGRSLSSDLLQPGEYHMVIFSEDAEWITISARFHFSAIDPILAAADPEPL